MLLLVENQFLGIFVERTLELNYQATALWKARSPTITSGHNWWSANCTSWKTNMAVCTANFVRFVNMSSSFVRPTKLFEA